MIPGVASSVGPVGRRRALQGVLSSLLVACSRATPPARGSAGVASRIVSLEPTTTEALFALGAGPRLVGRSRFCDRPLEALSLPTVGGYIDPNLEAILALRPDLVTGTRGPSGRGLADTLASRGVATYFPEAESRVAIGAMLRGLGERTGTASGAERLILRIDERLSRIAAALEGRRRPRALLLFGRAPIVVAGPGSFPSEMLSLAGADNAQTRGDRYPTIGLEHALALDPDVVLDAAMGGEGAPIGPGTPGWERLRAVRAGRVHRLSDMNVLRPGPSFAEGVTALALALHPGAKVPV